MVGPLTRQFIHQVHFSKGDIGIDGWRADTGGFTGRDMMRSDVVNAVVLGRAGGRARGGSSGSAKLLSLNISASIVSLRIPFGWEQV